jgi:hypothetical protein
MYTLTREQYENRITFLLHILTKGLSIPKSDLCYVSEPLIFENAKTDSFKEEWKTVKDNFDLK